MSTSQGQEPCVQTSVPPVFARSEVEQSHQCFRSPVMPPVRSPVLRMYLSPSFARSMDTGRRNSPTTMASPSAMMSLANAHTSVDITAVRRSPNAMTSLVGAHTSANASGHHIRSRKRKLTSDIWDDFTAIYDEDGTLMQGQCVHCDNIFPTSKRSGSSQCRRHRLVCTEKAKLDELISSMQPSDARIPAMKRFKYDKEKACHELIRMIVLHELPFRIVEYEGFRRFVASLNTAFKLMCRTTIKNDCMAEFDKQKLELLEVGEDPETLGTDCTGDRGEPAVERPNFRD